MGRTDERLQIVVRVSLLVTHDFVKLRDDTLLLVWLQFLILTLGGIGKPPVPLVVTRCHPRTRSDVPRSRRYCKFALPGPPLVLARGNILPTTTGEGGVLHGISQCPLNKFAAQREVLCAPGCVEIVKEPFGDLQCERGHVGVIVCFCVSLRHTSVLPPCYHKRRRRVGAYITPRGTRL